MKHEVITEEDGVFRSCDALLKKYMTAMPLGYTNNYMYEFVDGNVLHRKLINSLDDSTQKHKFLDNKQMVRKSFLKDLSGINNPHATVAKIVAAGIDLLKIRLPKLPGKKLAQMKLDSIALKLTCIPLEYWAYYLYYIQLVEADVQDQKSPLNKMGVRALSASSWHVIPLCHIQALVVGQLI